MVLLSAVACHIAQGTGGGEVADGVAGGVLENVVGHGAKGVFFAVHGAVFADEGEAVHIGVHHKAYVLAAPGHEGHDVAQVFL